MAGHSKFKNIQFRKGAELRKRRQMPRANAGHAEGDDPNPRLPVEGVKLEPGWNQRPQLLNRHGPVHEEQVMPAHVHREGARWGRGVHLLEC